MMAYSRRWVAMRAKMMVTPDFVSVWYLRPFDSNSITCAGMQRGRIRSASVPTPGSHFMRPYYDTARVATRAMLGKNDRRTRTDCQRWNSAEPARTGAARDPEHQRSVLESWDRAVIGARHPAARGQSGGRRSAGGPHRAVHRAL